MDIANDIRRMMADATCKVDKEWVESAQKEYPYLVLPVLLYLHRNGKTDGVDEEMLAKLAISVPDRRALYDILGDEAEKFVEFYPAEAEPAQKDTNETLDVFLSTYGNSDEKEIEMLNRMIFNPVPDYAQMLAAEEQESMPSRNGGQSEEDALINSFILKQKDKPGYFPTEKSAANEPKDESISEEPIEAPIMADDSMLSESLAKIYIKQRKYAKALEIIKTISLKFPEKSIYFADQIRFLRKMVKIETIKNNK